jgi:O-antigen/teichoic acid export membrane protein
LGVAASKSVRGLTTFLLARLFLGPADFGLFALVTAYLSGTSMLADLGITTSVIRHPRGDDPAVLNIAFLIQAGRGLVVTVAAIAVADPFANFYHQPKLFWLVIVAIFEVTIRGFTGASIWTLSRRVRTRELAFLTLWGDIAGLLASLVWALFAPSVWALVAGRLASALTYVIASHLLGQTPTRLAWDAGAAREILSFSAGLFLSSATFFLVSEGQRLAVAKFTTVAELGCLAIGMSLSTLPEQLIGTVAEKVFFPMISSATAASVDRAAAHFRTVRMIVLVPCCCIAVGFICCSGIITHYILGDRYQGVEWMLPWLGVRAALMLFSYFPSYMLFALGFSRYAAFSNLTRLVYLACALGVAFHSFGFRQAVWAIAMAPLVGYVPLLIGLGKHLRAVLRTELACAAVFVGVSAMAAVICGYLNSQG